MLNVSLSAGRLLPSCRETKQREWIASFISRGWKPSARVCECVFHHAVWCCRQRPAFQTVTCCCWLQPLDLHACTCVRSVLDFLPCAPRSSCRSPLIFLCGRIHVSRTELEKRCLDFRPVTAVGWRKAKTIEHIYTIIMPCSCLRKWSFFSFLRASFRCSSAAK